MGEIELLIALILAFRSTVTNASVSHSVGHAKVHSTSCSYITLRLRRLRVLLVTVTWKNGKYLQDKDTSLSAYFPLTIRQKVPRWT